MKRIAVCGSALMMAAGVGLLAGCGSGGGGAASTTMLTGNASVPPSQAALLTRRRSLFAMIDADVLGGPASATVPGSVGLANARVIVQTRTGHTLVTGPVTTSTNGSFSIPVPPDADDLEVDVTKPTSTGDTIEVKAALPPAASSVAVDEVSTVGAEAAEQDEAQGADTTTALQDADDVAVSQQQAENAGEPVPDLHQSHAGAANAPAHVAQIRLTANLGAKLGATLGQSSQSPRVRQAIMAAVTYARVNSGFNGAAITPASVRALSNGPATYTDAQVAAALVAAGVSTATTATVDASTQALYTTLHVTSAFDATKIPAGLAVLIGLQQISDSAKTTLFVNSLLGNTSGSSTATTGGSTGEANTTGTVNTTGMAGTTGNAHTTGSIHA